MKRFLVVLAVSACSDIPNQQPTPPPGSGSAATAPPAPAPTPAPDDRYDAGALGALAFEVSEGNAEGRRHFTRGLLALHSFWYDEAAREFQAAMTADPQMNMAYWGYAMSQCKLLWGEDELDKAKQVLGHMPDPDRLTPREQAWVLATVEMLKAPDVRESRKAFLRGMERVDSRYPDAESATFLALALLAATHPEDPDTVAVRKRAAGLARTVFDKNPKHPGAAHYLIHALDTPELAAEALPYARAYAKIAPAAFHARHMPAHIFSRLGMWSDAIASCRSAWDASLAAARRDKLSADHHDFHSLTWLVEMSFELGHRKDADTALATFAAAVRGGLGRQPRTLYANEIASYLARTGEWTRADELLAALDAPAIDDATPKASLRSGPPAAHCAPAPAANSPLPLVERLAILNVRARAAAARKDAAGAKKLLDEVDALQVQLRPLLATTQPKATLDKLHAVQARHRQTLLAQAAGNDRALLDMLRKSAGDADDETGGESNPTAYLPHEQIGDVLLRLGDAKAAAAEYALELTKHPLRAHSLLGAARAKAKAGDSQGAKAAYATLAELWTSADAGTDGLDEVRTAVR